jgi:erythromycin esterase-like protein
MYMSELRGIGRQVEDPASLGRAIDELLASPTLLALGEPTHGVKEFPLLRNELLSHLVVERGYRSIVLETDYFAASIVDDYVAGAAADIDTVLATGFSHGFGAIPGNRELVEWLREHNAGSAPSDRVSFHGFDPPLEMSSAPSPRRALSSVIDYLPASAVAIDALLGEDEEWTTEAAMFDPAASIGDTDRARALRIVADDLASTLRRVAPRLLPADYDQAVAHMRTAQGLLRYHAAMAGAAPDRMATLFSLRTEMMAENLLATVRQERGPILVFAHNAHLRPVGDGASWPSAGALVRHALGERYTFVAMDGSPHSEPGTLQGMLAEATDRRALFPVPALRTVLPPTIGMDEPIVRGHLPLNPAELDGVDAVIFVTDTDGKQHQYW